MRVFGHWLWILCALSVPAYAGEGEAAEGVDDEGAAEGEEDPCLPVCDVDVLHTCDMGEPVEIDCAAAGWRCAQLSQTWGDDCVLPQGAACAPGYAGGLSRCDPEASLYCIEGVCQVAEELIPVPTPEPTAGSAHALPTSSTNAFGCENCGSSSAVFFVPSLWSLRRLRRRIRETRQQRAQGG